MTTSSNNPTSRRTFLGAVATGSAAVAMAGAGLHAGATNADAAAIDASSDWSESWLTKINGKHKQFFDATTTGQWALVFAMNYLNAYNDAYKVPDSQLTAVVGLRHFAIGTAMQDSIWQRYKVAEFVQAMDPASKTPYTRNFLYHPKDGDMMFMNASVDKLMARGVHFTACNVALTAVSGLLSKNAGVSPEEAKKEWTANLIPGVVLVPSGVYAVNRAQEKGCTYCAGE